MGRSNARNCHPRYSFSNASQKQRAEEGGIFAISLTVAVEKCCNIESGLGRKFRYNLNALCPWNGPDIVIPKGVYDSGRNWLFIVENGVRLGIRSAHLEGVNPSVDK